jgi:hypothetical protein
MLVAAAASFDVRGFRGGDWFSLRWVMTHVIDEHARHKGTPT